MVQQILYLRKNARNEPRSLFVNEWHSAIDEAQFDGESLWLCTHASDMVATYSTGVWCSSVNENERVAVPTRFAVNSTWQWIVKKSNRKTSFRRLPKLPKNILPKYLALATEYFSASKIFILLLYFIFYFVFPFHDLWATNISSSSISSPDHSPLLRNWQVSRFTGHDLLASSPCKWAASSWHHIYV